MRSVNPSCFGCTLTRRCRWGIAIGMGVNLLVWPRSSEKELRQMLVLSLDHIGTFAHLLSKTYTMTITEDEKKVRDHLAQSLRVRTFRSCFSPPDSWSGGLRVFVSGVYFAIGPSS